MTWIPCLLLALLFFSNPRVVLAGTFTVDPSEDVGDANPGDGICNDGEGRCSLRAAIQEANAWPGADEIVLLPGTYTLTLAGTAEDANETGDLDIVASDPLTITGAGQDVTIIDASAIDRVMDVRPGAGPVYLSDLTLRGGWLADEMGSGLRVGDSSGEEAFTSVTAVEPQ